MTAPIVHGGGITEAAAAFGGKPVKLRGLAVILRQLFAFIQHDGEVEGAEIIPGN